MFWPSHYYHVTHELTVDGECDVPLESDVTKVVCVGYFLPRTTGSSYFDPSREAKSEHTEYSSTV